MEPRGKPEPLPAWEWCLWVVAQITDFLLKPVQIPNSVSSTQKKGSLAAEGRSSVAKHFSIRLIHNITTQYVVHASSRLGIGFMVGIQELAHEVGLRVKNMAGEWWISSSIRGEDNVHIGMRS